MEERFTEPRIASDRPVHLDRDLQNAADRLSDTPAATERPEGVLDASGYGNEALVAKHDVGVLEAAISQTEATMIQRCARDRNTQLAHICEVGEAELARRMDLAEDYLVLLAVDRPTGTDTTFQGTTNKGAEIRIRMMSEHLLEDRQRA